MIVWKNRRQELVADVEVWCEIYQVKSEMGIIFLENLDLVAGPRS